MARVVEEVFKPHTWSPEEAFSSGQTAYRLKVELSGNPFSANLASAWTNGWNDAAAKDITTPKKVDRFPENRFNEKRPRSYVRPRFS